MEGEHIKENTLDIYRRFKINIKEETYHNNDASLLMFKLRANVLRINNRKRHYNECTKCELCSWDNEDFIHFLVYCPALNNERIKITQLQRPLHENKDIGYFGP